jgi:L-iditol 2-dehydrogenase
VIRFYFGQPENGSAKNVLMEECMQAFLATRPHKYGLVEVDIPSLRGEDVLVRVEACGICGSDLDILKGLRPMEATTYPVILGHEFSGEIVEVGSAVRSLKLGDGVAIDTIVRCGACRNCLMGWTCHCLNGFQQLGCTAAGGMAEYVAVPQRMVYRLPEGMNLFTAALAEPASCAAHGVAKAEIKPGDSVVVVGAGSIGALVLQLARLFSPSELILIEIDDLKLQLGTKLCATHTINATRENVTERVMDITKGLGADAIVECTGSMEAVRKTFSYAGTKSRTVVVGVPPERRLEIDFVGMLTRDAVFRPSNGYTTAIWLWALDLLINGKIDANTIITHRVPLSNVDRAFNILQNRLEGAIKVMISPRIES